MLIVVMGMGRSGTSLIMQIMEAEGFDCGTNHISTNENNPRGFYEREQVLLFNLHLLQKATGDFLNLFPLPDMNTIDNMIGTSIPIQFPQHDYAVKDPRFSLTFPIWYPYLKQFDLRIVFSQRNKEAIAESMARAYNVDLKSGRYIINEYLKRTQFYIEKYHLRYESIVYEDWFTNPDKNLDALERLIGRKLNADVESVLDPELFHCRGESETVQTDQLPTGRYVSLNDMQVDTLKENFLVFEKYHPNLFFSLKSYLQETDMQLRVDPDGSHRFRKLNHEKDNRVEWTVTPPSQTANTYLNRYQAYSPQNQWLFILGIDALNLLPLQQIGYRKLGPIVVVEPDIERFLCYATLRPVKQLVILPNVFWYVGEEAFQELLDDLDSKLEPYLSSHKSFLPIIEAQTLHEQSSTIDFFQKRFLEILKQKKRCQ